MCLKFYPTGLTTPNGPCSAGYICISGATTAQPTDGITGKVCPQGSYCPEGSSVKTKCPKGTFGGSTGLQNMTECTACTPGDYCNIDGMSVCLWRLKSSYLHCISAMKTKADTYANSVDHMRQFIMSHHIRI